MVDVKTLDMILWGTVSAIVAGVIGYEIYILDCTINRPKRILKKIKAQYLGPISLDKAKEAYAKLKEDSYLRAALIPKKTVLSKEDILFIKKLEEKINPQIEKEIQGAKITPRTRLEDISKTYKEVSPYSCK